MKRRTLDIIFSFGGVLFAALLLTLGLVLRNQANFAKNYVRDQLSEQKITFTPVANLTAEEKQSAGLVTYAGQALTTGKQAEVYANEYIRLHLTEVNGGKTYAQTSTDSRAAAAAVTAAKTANPNDPALTGLTATATALDAKVQTLFRGETLRGLLLTSYGFSIFGDRAATAAFVTYLIAGLLALLSVAGLVHAFVTPKNRVVLAASVPKAEVAPEHAMA